MKHFFFFGALVLCSFTQIFAKNETKTFYRNTLVLAYSQVNSVYEDENIKLEIYGEKLWATNKTHNTIFIDLSQCFLVHNGSSFPMFTKDQNEKKASKKGVSTSIDEFITIAPSTGARQNETFICNMSSRIYGKYTTSETPRGDFSEYDKRFLEMINILVTESQKADSKGQQCLGTVSLHYTEDESVLNFGASIAYAFNKRSDNWTSVSLSTWISEVIFAPGYNEKPDKLKKKEKSGFGIKEVKPTITHIKASSPFEFDDEKSPMIVCDWEGNYKKGTYFLYPTNMPKGLLRFLPDEEIEKEYDTKRLISFDGEDADWGSLQYASEFYFSSQISK